MARNNVSLADFRLFDLHVTDPVSTGREELAKKSPSAYATKEDVWKVMISVDPIQPHLRAVSLQPENPFADNTYAAPLHPGPANASNATAAASTTGNAAHDTAPPDVPTADPALVPAWKGGLSMDPQLQPDQRFDDVTPAALSLTSYPIPTAPVTRMGHIQQGAVDESSSDATNAPAATLTLLSVADHHLHQQSESPLSGGHAGLNGVQAGSESLTVRLLVRSADTGISPMITFAIGMNWIEDGRPASQTSSFGFHADNIAAFHSFRPVVGPTPSPRGAFLDGTPGQTVPYYSGETREFGIQFHGVRTHCRNIMTGGNFGPFTKVITDLAAMLAHGCIVWCVAPDSHCEELVPAAIESMITEKRSNTHPLRDWFLKDGHGNEFEFQAGRFIPPEERPNKLLPPNLNYRDPTHYVVSEGYGFLQEYEFMSRKPQEFPFAAMRLLHVPGGGEDVLIGIVQRNEGDAEYEFNVRDEVLVRIHVLNPHDQDDAYWTATVVDHVPFARMHDVTLYLRRPVDDTGAGLGLAPSSIPGIKSYREMETPDQALKMIDSSPAVACTIKFVEQQKQQRRRVNILNGLQKNLRWEMSRTHGSELWEMIGGNRYDRLETRDLFVGVDNGLLDVVSNGLNAGQRTAFEECRRLRGGSLFVTGPPGTGKSKLLVDIGLTCLNSAARRSAEPRQVVVVSPLNHNVDQLAADFLTASAAFPHTVPELPVVIRLQAQDAETTLFELPGSIKRWGIRQHRIDHNERNELIGKASLAAQSFDRAVGPFLQPAIIYDPRVTAANRANSLGVHVLRVLGLHEDDVPSLRGKLSRASSTIQEAARTLARLYVSGQTAALEAEELSKYHETSNVVFRWVLRNADVVCCTMERLSDTSVYTVLQAFLFLADEQARALASENRVGRVAFPGCRFWISFGDPHQAKPRVHAPMEENCFHHQTSLSEFTRLALAGHPTVQLSSQHRCTRDIGRLLSEVFYRGDLRSEVRAELHPAAQKFARMTHRLNYRQTAGHYLFLNIPDSPETILPVTSTKVNIGTACCVWWFLEAMVRTYGFAPDEIAIVAPYAGQVHVHNHMRLQLDAKRRAEDPSSSSLYEDVLVTTIDKVQGLERGVVILDITGTTMGFLRDTNRINTGFSRAKYGLVVVAAGEILRQDRLYKSSALCRAVDHMKKFGANSPMPEPSFQQALQMYAALCPQLDPRDLIDFEHSTYKSDYDAFYAGETSPDELTAEDRTSATSATQGPASTTQPSNGADGTQPGNGADGTQPGNGADGTQSGNGADGTQSGSGADGTQSGNGADGTQSGNGADGQGSAETDTARGGDGGATQTGSAQNHSAPAVTAAPGTGAGGATQTTSNWTSTDVPATAADANEGKVW